MLRSLLNKQEDQKQNVFYAKINIYLEIIIIHSFLLYYNFVYLLTGIKSGNNVLQLAEEIVLYFLKCIVVVVAISFREYRRECVLRVWTRAYDVDFNIYYYMKCINEYLFGAGSQPATCYYVEQEILLIKFREQYIYGWMECEADKNARNIIKLL